MLSTKLSNAALEDGDTLMLLPARDGIQSACNDDQLLLALARGLAMGRLVSADAPEAVNEQFSSHSLAGEATPQDDGEALFSPEAAFARLNAENKTLQEKLARSEQVRQ